MSRLLDIREVAARIGLEDRHLNLQGRYRAKVSLDALAQGGPTGKYVLVSSMTPTPLGGGKTVTAIGLSMGFWLLGKRAAATIRQSALGPSFGVKGGGASRVEPFDECLLGTAATRTRWRAPTTSSRPASTTP